MNEERSEGIFTQFHDHSQAHLSTKAFEPQRPDLYLALRQEIPNLPDLQSLARLSCTSTLYKCHIKSR